MFNLSPFSMLVFSFASCSFFAILTGFSYFHERDRRHVPSLLVITIGFLSTLLRVWFFPELAPRGRPIGVGLVWRSIGLALVLSGVVMYVREWRRQRARLK
jgi:hypothetical protein